MIPEKMKTLKEFSVEFEYDFGKEQERADVILVTHQPDGGIECRTYPNSFNAIESIINNPNVWEIKANGEVVINRVIETKLYAIHTNPETKDDEKVLIGFWETLDHEDKTDIQVALDKFKNNLMPMINNYIKTGKTPEIDEVNEERISGGDEPKQ